MKKLILLFCALGMAVSSWGYDFMTDSIYYNITSVGAKTVEVTNNGNSGSYSDSVITIPSTVTNKNTGINYTVTSIGKDAFSGSNIISVTLPLTIKSIKEEAFNSCPQLKSFTITSSVDSIYKNAFSGCRLIPSINIPSSVTYISEAAFQNCAKLKGITVDNANTNYTAVDSVLFSKDMKSLICYPAYKPQASYTVPSSVDSIAQYAFGGSSKLTAISISPLIKTLNAYLFISCFRLKSIAIPASVTTINKTTFFSCDNLAVITVDNANTKFTAVDSILFSKDLGTLICYPSRKPETKYTIPSSVDSIANYAFSSCSNLTSLTINSSVTSLGVGIFENCTGLSSIAIPSSISTIPSATFFACTRLKTITLPNSIKTIKYDAFQNCDSLTSINLPASISIINLGAFSGCSALANIYAYPTTPVSLAYTDNVFYGVDTTKCTLHVPSGSLDAYKAAAVWKGFKITGDLSAVSNATASAVKVTVRNGQAVITGTEAGTALSVYNLQGTAIYTGKTRGETESIALPGRGVYIVQLGGKSVKVIY